jgi:hypothetical protein
MPLDVKVLALSGNRLVGATWPNPAQVEGTYNLIQRIYMNLVTEPGSVEDDPEYGAGLRSSMFPIPGNLPDRARQVASAVLTKCRLDLQSNNSPDPAERLVDLRLEDIYYDPDVAGWRLSVTVVSEATQLTIPV